MAKYNEPKLSSYGKHGDYRTMRIDLGPVALWYSFTTLVAFKVNGDPKVVHANDWGPTTGKHLKLIDDGDAAAKKLRVDAEEFDRRWNAEVAPLMDAAQIATYETLKSEPYLRGRRRIDRGIAKE